MSSSIQAEFKAIQDNQKLLVLLIVSFVAVLFWVVASIFKSQHSSTIDPELRVLSTPLNPSINTDVLNEIEQKRSYSEAELSSFPIFIRRAENQVISPFSGTATTPDTGTSPAPVNTQDTNSTSTTTSPSNSGTSIPFTPPSPTPAATASP